MFVQNTCFKNEPFYEIIGEVILKMNLIWDVKISEKFVKNSERVFITYTVKTLIKHVFLLFYPRENWVFEVLLINSLSNGKKLFKHLWNKKTFLHKFGGKSGQLLGMFYTSLVANLQL